MILLNPLKLLILSGLQSEKTLFDLADSLLVLLMLVKEFSAFLLELHIEFSLHQQLFGDPLGCFLSCGFLELEPEMKQVAELVVLHNIANCNILLVMLIHNTSESIRLSLISVDA
jgi:hypothetical protein